MGFSAPLRWIALAAGSSVATAITLWSLGSVVEAASRSAAAPWLLGRAAGLASYALLVALVALGLLLAHPRRAAWGGPSAGTRIRVHIALAAGTLVFTVLHVVVLVTDQHAGVGWAGLLPLGSQYRPVPVTLGVLGLWAGLAAGVTAAAAGRWAARVWRPVHRGSAAALALVWAHSLLAGSDSAAWAAWYAVSGAAVLALFAWRHGATPAAALAGAGR
jgi:hypothetical protein